jgi:hypothetical protein
MSKDKTMQLAVHQAVKRAAQALKDNDRDDAFLIDLGEDGILRREAIHPGQLSIDGLLFPVFGEEVLK